MLATLALAEQLHAHISDPDDQPRQKQKNQDGFSSDAEPSRFLDPVIPREFGDHSASHRHNDNREQAINCIRPRQGCLGEEVDHVQDRADREPRQRDQEGFSVG